MNQVSTIGFDIAKHVFQVHGTDAQGRLFKRKLRRKEVLAYFASLPPSLIGMEACGSAHYWARKLQGLAGINWNHSSGIAPRMLDQNWYIDGPMIMDTPFGTSFNDYQNNLDGPSLMTPRLMVNEIFPAEVSTGSQAMQ